MPIKLVTQANLTDCGLACVAMVTGKSLDTVLRVAIKECDYPKDGPHTTTDENLFKLLDHFGIKYGKKQKVKTVEALPPLAIMETRKMPSTGNSHLVVFERTAEGEIRLAEHIDLFGETERPSRCDLTPKGAVFHYEAVFLPLAEGVASLWLGVTLGSSR